MEALESRLAGWHYNDLGGEAGLPKVTQQRVTLPGLEQVTVRKHRVNHSLPPTAKLQMWKRASSIRGRLSI